MKKSAILLSVLAAGALLSNCSSTTRVVELTPVTYSKPVKKTPGPQEFKVINQYDR